MAISGAPTCPLSSIPGLRVASNTYRCLVYFVNIRRYHKLATLINHEAGVDNDRLAFRRFLQWNLLTPNIK